MLHWKNRQPQNCCSVISKANYSEEDLIHAILTHQYFIHFHNKTSSNQLLADLILPCKHINYNNKSSYYLKANNKCWVDTLFSEQESAGLLWDTCHQTPESCPKAPPHQPVLVTACLKLSQGKCSAQQLYPFPVSEKYIPYFFKGCLCVRM